MISAAILFSLLFYVVVSTSCSEDSSKSPDNTNANKQTIPLKHDMGEMNDALQILGNNQYNKHGQANLDTVSNLHKT